jgi:hypothetical protein
MAEKLSDDERIAEGQILCRAIIEVLGKPKEFVEETIRGYVKQLKEKKDYKVIEEEFEDAVPQDDGLFSTFVEITFWAKNTPAVIGFCFDYMPSSIEVLKPAKVTFQSGSLSSLLNDLQARLHHLDMMLKTLKGQGQILNKNAKSLLRNLLILSLKKGSLTIEDLSNDVGVKVIALEKLIQVYIKEGIIEKKEDNYSLVHGETSGNPEQG